VVNQFIEIENWRSSEGEIKCGVIFEGGKFCVKKEERERRDL
jgi:hypothetical protein